MGLLNKIFNKNKNNTNSLKSYNNHESVFSITRTISTNNINDTKRETDYILPTVDLIDEESSKKVFLPFIKAIKQSSKITKKVYIPIGINSNEKNYIIDNMNDLSNILISGTIMSGKSSYIHFILYNLLFAYKPSDLRLIIYDSKRIEYSQYKNIPHLLCPIINDDKKLSSSLKIMVDEIKRRYDVLEHTNQKNVSSYNRICNTLKLNKIPDIIIVIDDYTNLSNTEEVNKYLETISQRGWNVNVYLIVVANHPSAKIISTISKANFPTRISFKVTSKKDSMLILDQPGAESLCEIGSALYSSRFSNELLKIKIPKVSDYEISNIVNFVCNQKDDLADAYLLKNCTEYKDVSLDEHDATEEPLYNEIVDFVIEQGKASTSLLQRKFKFGYNRAARCIDLLEERGIVGPQKGSNPRDVLIKNGYKN